MKMSRRDPFAGSFRLLFEVGTVAGMSDGELLDRFLARRTVGAEAAEIAFGALVERHGPMVLRVCRSRLGDEHDAQDAFQATFLILARKAGSIRDRDSAENWLQGVARRVASCARRASAIRRARERAASRSSVEFWPDRETDELVPVVREEVSDLPEKYRTPLMLCLLDGLTHEEAATRLGWPVGTVKTRVRQAKDKLRTRLTRRGFAPTLGGIVAALTVREAQAIPAALVRATARAGLRHASGKLTTAGASSASVATLVQLGMGSLLMSRIKIAAIVLTSIGALAAGATGYARQKTESPEQKSDPVPVIAPAPEKAPVEPPRAAAAAVATDDRADRIEALQLDIELLQKEVDGVKFYVINGDSERIRIQSELDNLNGPHPDVMIYANAPNRTAAEQLDIQKKQLRDQLDTVEFNLKNNRAAYLAKSRELKEKQRQLKELQEPDELQEPAAQAKPVPAEPEQNPAAASDRLDQAITTSLKLEMIWSDFEFAKRRVFAAKESLLDVKKKAAIDAKTKRFGMSDKEYEAAFGWHVSDAEKEIVEANTNFEKMTKALVEAERELRELVMKLPANVQSQYLRWQASQKPAGTGHPAAEFESRIGDIERKLDLILKRLDAGPAGN